MATRPPKPGWHRKSDTWPWPEVAQTILEFIQGAYQPRTGAIATLLGLATLLFGASSIFVELQDEHDLACFASPPGRTVGSQGERQV